MPPKRRGGGALQRARSAADAQSDSASVLAYFLVRECLWGSISPEFARKVAKAAETDIAEAQVIGGGFTFRDLHAIASLPDDHT